MTLASETLSWHEYSHRRIRSCCAAVVALRTMPPSRSLRSSTSPEPAPTNPVATVSQVAARDLGSSFGLKLTRAQFKEKFTVKEIERDKRVGDYFRWCPYKKEFRSRDDFEPAQRFKSCDERYSRDFSDRYARAKRTPSLELNDNMISWAAEILNITLVEADAATVDGADEVAPEGSEDNVRLMSPDDSNGSDVMVPDAAVQPTVRTSIKISQKPNWIGDCYINDKGYKTGDVLVQELIKEAARQLYPPMYLFAEFVVKRGMILSFSSCSQDDLDQFYECIGLDDMTRESRIEALTTHIKDWIDDYKNGMQVNTNFFAYEMEEDEEYDPMSRAEVMAACKQENISLIMSTLGVVHDSFSVYKNVYEIERGSNEGKYMAIGKHKNGQNKCLGVFESEHEAALSYARHVFACAAKELVALAASPRPVKAKGGEGGDQIEGSRDSSSMEGVDGQVEGGGSHSIRQGAAPPRVDNPNLLPVAPTIAAHGPAGLGVLGVETVDTRGAAQQSPQLDMVVGVGNTEPRVDNPNLLPVAPTIASHGGGPTRNRNGKKKARNKKRGFVNVPREDFRRLQGNQRALVNGNQRSCAQDALVHAAKVLGVCVTKKQVYDATLPAEGDTRMGVIIDYALDALGIQMDDVRVKETLGFLPFQAKGGPEYALLQQTEGVFVVELCVSQSGKEDDYHAVVYDAGYEHVEYPGIRGAIIDNEKDTPIKFIEPSDRADVQKARDVFHSLFPFASDLRVVGAWLMRRVPYPPE